MFSFLYPLKSNLKHSLDFFDSFPLSPRVCNLADFFFLPRVLVVQMALLRIIQLLCMIVDVSAGKNGFPSTLKTKKETNSPRIKFELQKLQTSSTRRISEIISSPLKVKKKLVSMLAYLLSQRK